MLPLIIIIMMHHFNVISFFASLTGDSCYFLTLLLIYLAIILRQPIE